MGKIIMKAINTFLFVLCITIMLDFLAAADEIPDNVKTFPGHLKIKSNKNDGDGLCLSAEKFERGAKLFQQDCADANAWIIVNFRISRSKKRLFKKTKRWTDWRYSIETVPGRDFTFDPAGKKKTTAQKFTYGVLITKFIKHGILNDAIMFQEKSMYLGVIKLISVWMIVEMQEKIMNTTFGIANVQMKINNLE